MTKNTSKYTINLCGPVFLNELLGYLHKHASTNNFLQNLRVAITLNVINKYYGKKTTWQNTLSADRRLLKVDPWPWDVHDRLKWKAIGRSRRTLQCLEHGLKSCEILGNLLQFVSYVKECR